MIALKNNSNVIGAFLLISFIAISSCKKSEEDDDNLPPTPETPDLTHLPFGGNAPTNILIRNQGSPNPELLSLWLCGLPVDGAGDTAVFHHCHTQ
jgi:hypothetical protein